jgi:hypothetical protein
VSRRSSSASTSLAEPDDVQKPSKVERVPLSSPSESGKTDASYETFVSPLKSSCSESPGGMRPWKRSKRCWRSAGRSLGT